MKAPFEFQTYEQYSAYLRAYFAAMAMQAIIAYKPSGNPVQITQDIEIAIAHADELLKQLES